ncbi:hypothetical protein EGW08_023633 [Elysia chlorotica]|uniref:Uncharacterized protein n=1 Tax=Elysia chlorotica TaxID=188477 RepID=A0A3S0Z7C7_ELYCH|nr:hypothetical protein EGW08_023633 [Elysia chlorotica]
MKKRLKRYHLLKSEEDLGDGRFEDLVDSAHTPVVLDYSRGDYCSDDEDAVGGPKDPYHLYNSLSIVFPTVETIDMFQLLDSRMSFKSDDTHWSGHSEMWSKMWSEINIKRFLWDCAVAEFFYSFDKGGEVLDMLDAIIKSFEAAKVKRLERGDGEKSASGGGSGDYDGHETNLAEANTIKAILYLKWFKNLEQATLRAHIEHNVKMCMKLVMEQKNTDLGNLVKMYKSMYEVQIQVPKGVVRQDPRAQRDVIY